MTARIIARAATPFAIAWLSLFPLSAAAQAGTDAHSSEPGHHAHESGSSVNEMCPIGKEPIVPSAGTVAYKGHTVGLCCPGCGKQFLAWSESRKDEFITLAAAHREPGQERHAGHPEGVPAGDAGQEPASPGGEAGPTYPYTLDACPVGGPLGSMGDPVVRVYDNREVRFCCASCIEGFEADQAKYWGKIDAGIVAQQLMHYPIDSCIVTGKPLGDDSINHVHNNRLVRLHDAQALASFRADPATHLKALDKKIIALQRPGYPMDTCPVGGELGSMGEPVDFIYMNRLVRLCCSNCEKSIADDPAAYMFKLDAAYADQQRESYALESCVVTGAPLGSMGDPVELVAGTRIVRFCCDHCFPKFRENPARYLAKLPKD